jgi:hypothetical protein
VFEALLDDVLDEPLLLEAVDAAMNLLSTDTAPQRLQLLEAKLVKVESAKAAGLRSVGSLSNRRRSRAVPPFAKYRRRRQ